MLLRRPNLHMQVSHAFMIHPWSGFAILDPTAARRLDGFTSGFAEVASRWEGGRRPRQ